MLRALREWRDRQARIEGVETFRVFPNAVLDAITGTLPKNKEELLLIKGIKEAKYQKYGKAILMLVEKYVETKPLEQGEMVVAQEKEEFFESASNEPISVSQFLDGLNTELSGMAARIRGEVSSVDERERVIYFSIKDSEDGSLLPCIVFRYHYEISGVTLAIGDEIIIEGAPEIYKPYGKLSLKVSVIELCGEGALKKAYDALKVKLEMEGLFSEDRKRPLPFFPERIALITSEQGAAIGDFTTNLGRQGFRIRFYPVAVEGKRAVLEIIKAVRFFNRHPEQYDVLVLVRGGGSLESLQAFNNEALVREIAQSKIPTLFGVGHEKDVTLAALVADTMVSTPTATAKELRYHWDEARQMIAHFERQLPMLFERQLSDVKGTLTEGGEVLLTQWRAFREQVASLRQDVSERLVFLQSVTRQKLADVAEKKAGLLRGFLTLKDRITKELNHGEERLKQYDPKRALKLGYGLIRKGNRVIKDVSETGIGDILDIQLSRGRLQTKVTNIIEE